MQTKRVPVSTQHQVLAYLEHAEKQTETLADIDAIQTLSPTLRDEVAYNTMSSSISTYPLFEYAFGMPFLQQVCSLLELELFGPDDVICMEGHLLTQMVFVNRGRLKLFSSLTLPDRAQKTSSMSSCSSVDKAAAEVSHRIVDAGEVPQGKTFGASALFLDTSMRSPVTVLCFEFCELGFLTRQSFLGVIARNPEWDSTRKKINAAIRMSQDQVT